MNTQNKQHQKPQRQKTRQVHGTKKRGQISGILQNEVKNQDQEHPETRMTR